MDIDTLIAKLRNEATSGSIWKETDARRLCYEAAEALDFKATQSVNTEDIVCVCYRYRDALIRIEKWFGEFPRTGKYWEKDGEEMSYSACYGSSGERDYMRNIAMEALQPVPSPLAGTENESNDSQRGPGCLPLDQIGDPESGVPAGGRGCVWRKIEHGETAGNIELPEGPPFDGNAILILTNTGVVEAWWDNHDWDWVCYDDAFQLELGDALYWMPIPVAMNF